MKKWIGILMMACLLPTMGWAQQQRDDRAPLSREEFQKRHEAYLTKYADLTAEEAAKFFPLYNELQQKKNEYNGQTMQLLNESRNKELDERRYKELLESMSANAIATESLERTYLDKFKEVISYKKIFKIKEAESRFRQELVRGMRRPGPDGRRTRPDVPDTPTQK